MGVVVLVITTAQSWSPRLLTSRADVAVFDTPPASGSKKRFDVIAMRITVFNCLTGTIAQPLNVSYEIVPASSTRWKMLKFMSHCRHARYCIWIN